MVQRAKYHLVSRYRLSSRPDVVWETLFAVLEWPKWWRWSKKMDQVAKATGAHGVGASYRQKIGSPLLYSFTYTATIDTVVPDQLLETTLTGDLEGRSRFDLTEAEDGGTAVTVTQLYETPKWWMNLMAPMSRPALVWNHDKLMSAFGRGLAERTGGRVIDMSHAVLGPKDPGFFQMPEHDVVK